MVRWGSPVQIRSEAQALHRPIAQLAERRSPKPKVVGSIPTGPVYKKRLGNETCYSVF